MTIETDLDALVADVDTRKNAAAAAKVSLTLTAAASAAAVPVSQAAEDVALAQRDVAQGYLTGVTALAAGSTGATAYANLKGIIASKAEQAVDVFIYDTSKDSDGGVWRNRCHGTSWFNETLNTATRGSRKEFPAVAVIIATVDTIKIYDADDPALPMWMMFNQGGGGYAIGASDDLTSISMVNGVLAIGAVGSHIELNFLADFAEARSAASYVRRVNPLSGRNSGGGTTTKSASGNTIVNATVYDVAMTVLPDAPIDPATALPVPTIAVATAGGVSVIRDDGTVVDSAASDSQSYIVFDPSGRLYFMQDQAGDRVFSVSDYSSDGFVGDATYWVNGLTNRKPDLLSVSGISEFEFEDQSNGGLIRVVENPTDFAQYMHANITSNHNTGWMLGDIKGAFLSSTDPSSLVGSGEMVPNGDFATNSMPDWVDQSVGTGTVDASTGALVITSTDNSNYGKASLALNLIVGETYLVRFSVSGVQTYAGGNLVSTTNYGAGEHSQTVVANTALEYLNFQTGGNDGVTTIDNISVKLADKDRSVSTNDLIINGTIARTPVAADAELVGYGGFSASNRLEQPHNADMDFGTGDFSVLFWWKTPNLANATPIERGDQTTTESRWGFYINAGEVRPYLNEFIFTGAPVMVDQWALYAMVRRSGVLEVYSNGVLRNSIAATGDVSSIPRSLHIGARSAGANHTTGELALIRISANAPTAEQMTKIFEDEKHMFAPGAKCTLHGASDAVTALAYDKATDLLHVGTSGGRSVFDGLVRVDQTDVAVGTAIAAHNGLVIED